jgi:hypothetical protein
MTTTATPAYGSAAALTITLASLAFSATAGRESTAIDNATTDDAIDAELGGKITTGTSPTANNVIEVWVYGSYDGTTYTGSATGSDAALTPTSKSLLKLGQIIQVTGTSNVTYAFHLGSVAALFGGIMPTKWGVWVLNNSGANLHATGGNHEIKYRTIKYESA